MIPSGGDVVEPTGAARAVMPNAEAPTSPEDLRAMWRQKFGAAPRRMFDAFVNQGPMTRDALAETTGIEREVSTFRNGFSMLHAAGVLRNLGDDTYDLAEELR